MFLFLFLPTSGNLVDFSNFVIIVNKIVKYIERCPNITTHQEQYLTPTSPWRFSILFSTHFLRYLKGEFVFKSMSS